MFCPKCGSLLKIAGKTSSCSCGYATKTKDVLIEQLDQEEREIVVLPETNPFSTEEHVCQKCGFGKAVLIESQIAVRETWNTSEADRPSYVCGRCGYKEFVP